MNETHHEAIYELLLFDYERQATVQSGNFMTWKTFWKMEISDHHKDVLGIGVPMKYSGPGRARFRISNTRWKRM